MIPWLFRNVVQIGVRLLVTLVACISLQHIIQFEGYRCELNTLLLAAALVIVTTRVWAPWSRDT